MAKADEHVGKCPRCATVPSDNGAHIGGGMFLEFTCPTCKLRACWSYVGPPGISIWFDQEHVDAANAYLKSAMEWRKKAFARNSEETGFTWDMTPPPAPTKDLFRVCVDMNYQHVELKPRTEEG